MTVSGMGHNQLHFQAGEPGPRWDPPFRSQTSPRFISPWLGNGVGVQHWAGVGFQEGWCWGDALVAAARSPSCSPEHPTAAGAEVSGQHPLKTLARAPIPSPGRGQSARLGLHGALRDRHRERHPGAPAAGPSPPCSAMAPPAAFGNAVFAQEPGARRGPGWPREFACGLVCFSTPASLSRPVAVMTSPRLLKGGIRPPAPNFFSQFQPPLSCRGGREAAGVRLLAALPPGSFCRRGSSPRVSSFSSGAFGLTRHPPGFAVGSVRGCHHQ